MDVYIDTETTGLNNTLKLDEVIQIGACDETGTPLLDALIRPTRASIDAEALSVTGIDPETVAGSPPFSAFANALSTLLMSADTVWFYNAAFDVRILLNSYWAAGLVMPVFSYRCLMLDYAEAYGEPSEKHGWRSQKLTAACEQQGLPPRTAHNALADAQMAAMLHCHMNHGTMRRYGEAYPLALTAVERRQTRHGQPYMAFSSDGGTTVNVFNNQVGMFEAGRYPMAAWLARLEEGRLQPLSRPIIVTVQAEKGYLNVIALHSEYTQSIQTASGEPTHADR